MWRKYEEIWGNIKKLYMGRGTFTETIGDIEKNLGQKVIVVQFYVKSFPWHFPTQRIYAAVERIFQWQSATLWERIYVYL